MSERQPFGLIQTLVGTMFTQSITNLTSSIDVSDYSKLSFQPTYIVSGSSTGSVIVQSSLDGTNWFNDFTFVATSNSSSFYSVSTKRSYMRSLNSISGNVTGSLFFIAGS